MSRIRPIFLCSLLLAGKLGRNSPDKKNVFSSRGEAIHQNAVIPLPERKQTLMLLSACAAFRFATEFVNYLDALCLCMQGETRGLDYYEAEICCLL